MLDCCLPGAGANCRRAEPAGVRPSKRKRPVEVPPAVNSAAVDTDRWRFHSCHDRTRTSIRWIAFRPVLIDSAVRPEFGSPGKAISTWAAQGGHAPSLRCAFGKFSKGSCRDSRRCPRRLLQAGSFRLPRIHSRTGRICVILSVASCGCQRQPSGCAARRGLCHARNDRSRRRTTGSSQQAEPAQRGQGGSGGQRFAQARNRAARNHSPRNECTRRRARRFDPQCDRSP